MKILMFGPGRKVKGGISSVVNAYYEQWNPAYQLTYVSTMEDGGKLLKALVFIVALMKMFFLMPGCDIVHVHMASENSFRRKRIILKWAKRLHKKKIIHVHGAHFMLFYHENRNAEMKRKIQEIFQEADYVIALSQQWKTDLTTIWNAPMKVIYNAVPCPQPFDKPMNNDICFLGRLGERKGIFDLLDVVTELNKKYDRYHVRIGGDGDVEGVKRVIRERGLSNVLYVGWLVGQDKAQLLRTSMIFVLPSYHEGLPMALLEAMSYRCVPVSTNVGGIPEVLHHGENGFLVAPGDKDQLYVILDRLLSGQIDKEVVSEAAFRTIVEEYSLESSMSQLYALYDLLA